MPFQKRSHGRLGERAAVEALARALCDTRPSRPLGARLKEAAARLREEMARPAPVVDVAEGGMECASDSSSSATPVLEEADIDAAQELLLPLALRADHNLGRFLLELSTSAEIDAWDPRAERISLLTLHAAKGLEFRVVFLVGCEDGLLPLRISRSEDTPVLEERRLFYVGMTRARERLFLTHARERTRYGKVVRAVVSPFVRDIEERLLEPQEAPRGKKAAPVAGRQLKLF
jgi:DNA helicase-2/ATP-dependent DNA helicase PcrA